MKTLLMILIISTGLMSQASFGPQTCVSKNYKVSLNAVEDTLTVNNVSYKIIKITSKTGGSDFRYHTKAHQPDLKLDSSKGDFLLVPYRTHHFRKGGPSFVWRTKKVSLTCFRN